MMRELQRLLSSAVLALGLVLSGPVHAAYFDGMFAFDTGDYPRALEEWRAEAGRGDAKSFYGLGQLYEEGLGVQADLVLAYAYYDLAYLRGHEPAVDARERVKAKLQSGELADAKAVVAQVKGTGELPPVTRQVAFGQAPAPSSASTSGVQAETAASAQTQGAVKSQTGTSSQIPQSTVPVQTSTSEIPAAIPAGSTAIDLIYVCEFRAKWTDEGSGGRSDVALYEPVVPPGYWMVGGYAQGNYEEPHGCVAAIKPLTEGLLLPPREWKQLWSDRGSGAQRDGSIWQAVPAGEDFVCLGAIAQSGYQPPGLSNYACVHRCMVQELAPSRPLWTDEGTGAQSPVAIYMAPLTNTMAVSPNRGRPPAVRDLDPMAACLHGQ